MPPPQGSNSRTPNRLFREKSPYLLQHACNPVDWFAWCHVMEREVFEDDSIAALLNTYALSIEVDRENDHFYMLALQAMTGGGGRPMSIFMTPDRMPFLLPSTFRRRPGLVARGLQTFWCAFIMCGRMNTT